MKIIKSVLMGAILLICLCVAASANRYVDQNTHTITWCDNQWVAKYGIDSPLNNNWSDAPNNLWVDDQERLHLTVKNDGGKWNCTQLTSVNEYHFGTFAWIVNSPVFTYDQNITLGLFLYADDNHELDIEVGQYSVGGGDLVRFTAQPYYIPGNTVTRVPLKTVNGVTTDLSGYDGHNAIYYIDWKPTYFDAVVRNDQEQVIGNKFYTNTSHIPNQLMKMVMNFYIGAPPADGQDMEVIIESVDARQW